MLIFAFRTHIPRRDARVQAAVRGRDGVDHPGEMHVYKQQYVDVMVWIIHFLRQPAAADYTSKDRVGALFDILLLSSLSFDKRNLISPFIHTA
jgi:hypothetical protein